MGLSNEYLAPVAEKLYLQFLSWIWCSLLVLRGYFGSQKSVRHAGNCPTCASITAGVEVTNAWGQLLPLLRFWLLLFTTTAHSGNLSGVKKKLVGPQNKYNTITGRRKGPAVPSKVLPSAPLSCVLSDQ